MKNISRKLLFFFICLLPVHLYAQQLNVKGKVIGANDNDPIPGASIKVKGTERGTVANKNGEFEIFALKGETIQVSFIGYLPQEQSVDKQAIVFKLQSSNKILEEVVVTSNGIKRLQRSLGYGTATITGDELTVGKERSVLNALDGKVSGVQISSSSGGVGSSTRIVFRGGTSILGDNQPLIVVDGIPIDNSQQDARDNLNIQVDAGNKGNDINPEDVESITVLKGPAAAALYGTRAANGALIITTKSGKSSTNKRAEINIASNFNAETVLKLPDFQNEFGQGGQGEPDSRENFSWGPKFDGVIRPWGQVINGEQKVKPYSALPNNVRDFFEVGHTFNNNISISKSNENSSYFLSVNNIDQKGVLPNTKYNKTSVRFNGTSQLSNKFYSSASINYIKSRGDLSIQGQSPNSPYNAVTQTPRDIPLRELRDYKNDKFSTLTGYYGAYTTNPYYVLGEDSYLSSAERVLGNALIGFKPIKWVDVNLRVGTDVASDRRYLVISKRDIPASNQNNGQSYIGRYQEGAFNVREFTSDLIATANRNLTKDLKLTALVGFNVRQRGTSSLISNIDGLVIPGFYNLTNNSSPVTVGLDQNSLRRLYGVYGDISFALKNYLFLDVTGRNDWSSTLPLINNNFFYPSASLAFVISDLIKLPKDISFAKIRLAAAQVGNDADPYQIVNTFERGSVGDGFNNSRLDFPLNTVPGYVRSKTLGQPNIRPEITTSYEGGIELNLFNDRFGLEATAYFNGSKDQIIPVSIAATTGFLGRTANAGKITNKGIELAIKGRPIVSGGFVWELNGTFTRNVNKVVELFPGVSRIDIGTGTTNTSLVGLSLAAVVGQPYGSFFGTDFERNKQGQIVVDKTTGYPVTAADAQVQGNIQPKYLASLANTFSFKGFSLNFLFSTKQGGSLYSRTKQTSTFVGTNTETVYNNREPFVVPNSVIKQTDGTYIQNTVKVQDVQNYWTRVVNANLTNGLIDASYIKLREVALSYQFPKKVLSSTPFGALSIGFVGRNLLLWTPKSNTFVDPETSSFGTSNTQGYEYTTIPSVRSYGVNLRASF